MAYQQISDVPTSGGYVFDQEMVHLGTGDGAPAPSFGPLYASVSIDPAPSVDVAPTAPRILDPITREPIDVNTTTDPIIYTQPPRDRTLLAAVLNEDTPKFNPGADSPAIVVTSPSDTPIIAAALPAADGATSPGTSIPCSGCTAGNPTPTSAPSPVPSGSSMVTPSASSVSLAAGSTDSRNPAMDIFNAVPWWVWVLVALVILRD